jgi:hypothetical protein
LRKFHPYLQISQPCALFEAKSSAHGALKQRFVDSSGEITQFSPPRLEPRRLIGYRRALRDTLADRATLFKRRRHDKTLVWLGSSVG